MVEEKKERDVRFGFDICMIVNLDGRWIHAVCTVISVDCSKSSTIDVNRSEEAGALFRPMRGSFGALASHSVTFLLCRATNCTVTLFRALMSDSFTMMSS